MRTPGSHCLPGCASLATLGSTPQHQAAPCLLVGLAAEPAPCLRGDAAMAQAGTWNPSCQWAQNWHQGSGTRNYLFWFWCAEGERRVTPAQSLPPRHGHRRPAYTLTAEEARLLPAPLTRHAAGRRQLGLHSRAGLAPASPGLRPHALPRWHRSVLGDKAPSCHWHPDGKRQRGFPTFAHGSAVATGLPLCWRPASPCARGPARSSPTEAEGLPSPSVPKRAKACRGPADTLGGRHGSLRPNPVPRVGAGSPAGVLALGWCSHAPSPA